VKVSTIVLSAFAGAAIAQPCQSLSRIVSPTAAAEQQFGWSTSMSFGGPNNRPLLAVGKPFADSGSTNEVGGWSVWEHVNGSWSMVHDAVNTGGGTGEQAGSAISISDPYMIVGAPEYETRGRVLIFKRATGSNNWVLDDTASAGLIPGTWGAEYGRSVAITAAGGGWAIVGAPLFSTNFEDSGRVYVMYRNASTNEWIQSFSMDGSNNPLATIGGDLGNSVAISQTSEWVAWGAPDQTAYPQFPKSGTAYVMNRQGQSPTMISRVDSETDMGFGKSVAVEGEWLAVGAPRKDATAVESGQPSSVFNCGAVYMYRYQNNQWVFHGTLRAPLPTPNAWFGNNVRMSGNQLLVHEFGTDRVYVFNFANGVWAAQAKFEAPAETSVNGFRGPMAIRDGLIAMSDSGETVNGLARAGAVYTTSVAPTLVSGDTCSNPIPLPTGTFVGCTDTATPSFGNVTTCGLGGGGQGPDVWFRFAPECSGNAIFDTLGSTFDTVLSVHSGCPTAASGNSLVCNDDGGFAAPNNRASIVSLTFQGGQTYFIRVSGYNTASGQYTLRSLISYGLTNDECSTATTIGTGIRSFNTCAATNSAPAGVPLGSTRDVWFRFIAPNTNTYTLSTCGSNFDTVITLFSGSQSQCPSAATGLIGQNNNSSDCSPLSLQSSLSVPLTQGQSVMIRVGGANANAFGQGTLSIAQFTCDPLDFNNDGSTFDPTDIDAFLSVFSEGPCIPTTATCNDLDFNNDGSLFDPCDIDSFMLVFSEGPCTLCGV
jgi:hypothetical protein